MKKIFLGIVLLYGSTLFADKVTYKCSDFRDGCKLNCTSLIPGNKNILEDNIKYSIQVINESGLQTFILDRYEDRDDKVIILDLNNYVCDITNIKLGR